MDFHGNLILMFDCFHFIFPYSVVNHILYRGNLSSLSISHGAHAQIVHGRHSLSSAAAIRVSSKRSVSHSVELAPHTLRTHTLSFTGQFLGHPQSLSHHYYD